MNYLLHKQKTKKYNQNVKIDSKNNLCVVLWHWNMHYLTYERKKEVVKIIQFNYLIFHNLPTFSFSSQA